MINPELITQLRAAADAMEKELCTSYEGTLTLDLLGKLKWKISIDVCGQLVLESDSLLDNYKTNKDKERFFGALSASPELLYELYGLIREPIDSLLTDNNLIFSVVSDPNWNGPRIWFQFRRGSHLKLKEVMKAIGIGVHYIANRSDTVDNLRKERHADRLKVQQEEKDWAVIINMIAEWPDR